LVLGLVVKATTNKTWLLFIAFGIFMHLILDQMWLEPRTFFWPFLGWDFPKSPHQEFFPWLLGIFRAIIKDPRVFLSELVGLLILIWVGAVVLIASLKSRRTEQK
jgi:hypothetical protein